MILVTAATGQYGRLVVEALLQKLAPKDLAVAVRHPEKAREWRARGVSVRQADYDDLSSLHAAFDGISDLLFISSPEFEIPTRMAQHERVIEGAKRAGDPGEERIGVRPEVELAQRSDLVGQLAAPGAIEVEDPLDAQGGRLRNSWASPGVQRCGRPRNRWSLRQVESKNARYAGWKCTVPVARSRPSTRARALSPRMVAGTPPKWTKTAAMPSRQSS